MLCNACGIVIKKNEDKWYRVEWKVKPDDETTTEVLCDPCTDKIIARDDMDDFIVIERYDDRNEEVIEDDNLNENRT